MKLHEKRLKPRTCRTLKRRSRCADMHLTFGYCPGPDMHGYDKLANEIMEMMK